MEPFISKQLCGFWKGCNTQYCILFMPKNWKSVVDKRKYFAALFKNVSKAFDFISHELLPAKLLAYGFSLAALRLIHSCLTKRKQINKANSDYSLLEEIFVWQASILGTLPFNIFLCNLSSVMKDVFKSITRKFKEVFFSGFQIIKWRQTMINVILYYW